MIKMNNKLIRQIICAGLMLALFVLSVNAEVDSDDISNFRGGQLRDMNGYVGNAGYIEGRLEETASFSTGWSKHQHGGGGQGWTGQSLIMNWTADEVDEMQTSIYGEFLGKPLTEIISGSLDGKVYFRELGTFKATRKPLDVGNSIKGTPATDGKVLYVGNGLPEKSPLGFGIYNLKDLSKIHYVSEGGWRAADSSALFMDGKLFVLGENGIFYRFIPKEGDFRNGIAETKKLSVPGGGGESSVAGYKGKVYFASKTGKLYAVDTETMQVDYTIELGDDTDCTMYIDVDAETDTPYAYIGSESDTKSVNAYFYKIDLRAGVAVWKNTYKCYRVSGSDGGFLASPVVDKDSNLVYVSISRIEAMTAGKMMALDMETGKEVYATDLRQYSWSSPLLINHANGKYIVHFDRGGWVDVYTTDLKKVSSMQTNLGKIECSPVGINSIIICGGRAGMIKQYVLR